VLTWASPDSADTSDRWQDRFGGVRWPGRGVLADGGAYDNMGL